MRWTWIQWLVANNQPLNFVVKTEIISSKGSACWGENHNIQFDYYRSWAVRRNQNTMNKKEINHVTGRIWCNHSSVYTRVLPIIYGLLYRSVCNDGPIAAEQIVFNRLFALEPKHTYLISRGIEISAPIQFAAKIPHEISCLFNKLSVNRKSWMNNIGKTRKTLSEHDKS